jgi:hypothetical protein
MAEQVIIKLTDDLDGSNADRIAEFDLGGVTCTIDRPEKNAA